MLHAIVMKAKLNVIGGRLSFPKCTLSLSAIVS